MYDLLTFRPHACLQSRYIHCVSPHMTHNGDFSPYYIPKESVNDILSSFCRKVNKFSSFSRPSPRLLVVAKQT